MVLSRKGHCSDVTSKTFRGFFDSLVLKTEVIFFLRYKMVKEGIYERSHGMMEGYTDLEIANVCVSSKEEDATAVVTLRTSLSPTP